MGESQGKRTRAITPQEHPLDRYHPALLSSVFAAHPGKTHEKFHTARMSAR